MKKSVKRVMILWMALLQMSGVFAQMPPKQDCNKVICVNPDATQAEFLFQQIEKKYPEYFSVETSYFGKEWALLHKSNEARVSPSPRRS